MPLPNNHTTYEEFLKLAEESDTTLEFIDGVIYDMGTPTRTHQAIVRNLCNLLGGYFSNKPCDFYPAPLDLYMEGLIPNRVQPDIMIICDLSKFNKTETQYEGVPTIVIEILSPSTAQKDQFVKFDVYTRLGIPEYWIVSPTYKDIQVFKLNTESEGIRYSDTLTTDLFEGLEIDIKKVFKIKDIGGI